jgi:hypothetical protein
MLLAFPLLHAHFGLQVLSDAESALPLKGMESIEGFKKSVVTMVSGSISDGYATIVVTMHMIDFAVRFDDLASSVRRASTVVGALPSKYVSVAALQCYFPPASSP